MSSTINVRLPDSLKDWIADQARQHRRSQNGQIIWMLEMAKPLIQKQEEGDDVRSADSE